MNTTPGTHFFLGLDLGQRHDFTALAILERTVLFTGRRDPVSFQLETQTSLCFRHLHRYPTGTSYTAITDDLRRLVSSPQLANHSTLVLDATGIGGPVLDLLRAARLSCPLIPVTITGGDNPSISGGSYRVPKRDLVLAFQIALDNGSLSIASDLPGTPALLDELAQFRIRISASGHDSYSAPSGAHDDLIIAASLALWRANRRSYSLGVPHPLPGLHPRSGAFSSVSVLPL
jgi:hypothetical protein